jgi:hypothetical protein
VVRKASPAFDLDNRQPFAIFRLERGVAADVDLAEIELELLSNCSHALERDLAEVAPLRVVDDDLDGYG